MFGLLRLRVIRTELHHDQGFDERLLVPLVVLPQLLALRCSFRAPMTAGRWSSPPHQPVADARKPDRPKARGQWVTGQLTPTLGTTDWHAYLGEA